MALGMLLTELSHEDLRRWREVLADYEVALLEAGDWSSERRREAVIAYFQIFGELKERYLTESDRDEAITIGASTGDVRIEEDP